MTLWDLGSTVFSVMRHLYSHVNRSKKLISYKQLKEKIEHFRFCFESFSCGFVFWAWENVLACFLNLAL